MPKRYKFLKPADIPLDAVRGAKLVLVDEVERDAVPTLLEAARSAGVHVNSVQMIGSTTIVFCYLRVADYDFWTAGYARAIEATKEVKSFRIWRGQDDPNYVITAEAI
jgi:hypothetical protein